MKMKYGLVGNSIYYGGASLILFYCGYEVYESSKDMTVVNKDHPASDILKGKRKLDDEDIKKLAAFQVLQENLKKKDKEILKQNIVDKSDI